MSRLLSSLGIGAATVDTVLPTTDLTPGESVEVSVELTGGDSPQEVDALYFALLARVAGEDHVLDQFRLTDPISLDAEETLTRTTEVAIPSWTPVTRGSTRVWLQTGLDIAWAVDPTDEDDVDVHPGPYLRSLFAAIDDLGFDHHETEARTPTWLEDRPFAQAFTFTPDADDWPDLDGLTLVCDPRGDDLKTVVEIDEHEPAEAYTDVEYDSQEVVHVFDTTDEDMMRRQLESVIDQYTHVDDR